MHTYVIVVVIAASITILALEFVNVIFCCLYYAIYKI